VKSDVVICWSFATVPASVKAHFQRPTTFVELPTPAGRKYGAQLQGFGWPLPVKGILAKYAPGVEPLRLAALGFSESCGGVGGLLKSDDGGRFDAMVAIDGIHTAPAKAVNPAALTYWVAFGRRAGGGTGLCLITHSSVEPPYASTTATANFIWNAAAETSDVVAIPAIPDLEIGPSTAKGGASPPYNKTIDYPSVLGHMQPPRRANGLVILGWNNLDPSGTADHRWQSKVVRPLVLKKFLVARWNAIDPADPEASCYVG
jgi:hypothetical protein